MQTITIWVQFPKLGLKYYGLESLSKIGSIVGIPLKSDKTTKEKTTIKYARMLVEVPIDGPFPEHFDFVNDLDMVIRQKVVFEWKSVK